MSRRENHSAQYTINLRESFEQFVSDFWEEFKHQETKVNKSSERRMRSLLRKFNERVAKPYRAHSLNENDVNLENIIEGEQ